MRGVAGGTILGVPLLYTQEIWLHGRSVAPIVILAALVAGFCVNLALSSFIGFRAGRIMRPTEDAVVGMGLSVVLSALLLILLDRIDTGTSGENALGVIALTAIPVSLGFSVGSALAPAGGGAKAETIRGGGGDLLVAAAGALVFALNIAPTAEPNGMTLSWASFRGCEMWATRMPFEPCTAMRPRSRVGHGGA